jgi:hypothetical protein
MEAYVPIYSEGEKTWYPCNEASITLVRLVHAWRDVSKLNEIRMTVRNGDEIADKLLLKFMIIEFFSAVDHARKLQGIVRKSPRLVVGSPAPARYITKTELDKVDTVYKNFWREYSPKEQLIARIRNNIGAHRSAEIGVELDALWMELEPENFISVLNCIPPVIEATSPINIYDWSVMPSEPSEATFLGCRIVHNWADAFES